MIFCKKGHKSYLSVAKRALHDVCETEDVMFALCPDEGTQVKVYADYNWEGEPGFVRTSRIGIFAQYRKARLYITSCSQKKVSVSSSETEYMALSDACRLVAWLRQLCRRLWQPQQATLIHQDSNSTIDCTEDRLAWRFSLREHMNIGHHFVMTMVQDGAVWINTLLSQDM